MTECLCCRHLGSSGNPFEEGSIVVVSVFTSY